MTNRKYHLWPLPLVRDIFGALGGNGKIKGTTHTVLPDFEPMPPEPNVPDIHELYDGLKDKHVALKMKCNGLLLNNIELKARIDALQNDLEQLQQEGFLIKDVSGATGRNYVTVKKYTEQKKLTQYFIKLYHEEKNKRNELQTVNNTSNGN